MNTGTAYTQEYASIDLAEDDGVTDTSCKESVEVTTCKALLKHLEQLNEFPECSDSKYE